LEYSNEQCFLRGPCRDVIRMTVEARVQRVVRESVKRRFSRFPLCDSSLLPKEHRVVVFKKVLQRRFFERKKEDVIRVSRTLHTEKLHNLYPLPSFKLLKRLNES
jgi:hypothetical protein